MHAMMMASAIGIYAFAAAFLCWVAVSLYRAHTSRSMATYVKPRTDERSSIEQFQRIMRP